MIELKPCPFCGGNPRKMESDLRGCFVMCDKCGSQSHYYANRASATKAWNRRTVMALTLDRICKDFEISDIGEFSDGYHTFNSLYHQRAVLFATIVNQNKKHAWKSYKHENGELCFGGGWFIVGIDTPEGSYTYHYKNDYWDMFHCEELEVGKHWDGHTEKDVTRLLSLED